MNTARMHRTRIDQSFRPQLYRYSFIPAFQPQTMIVVYEQPKVVIERRYSTRIVPCVDPGQYQQRYDSVLLDTSALLELTRRLNIDQKMVN